MINSATTHFFVELDSAASENCANISTFVLREVFELFLERVSELRSSIATVAHCLREVVHHSVPGVVEEEQGSLSPIGPICDSFLPEIAHELAEFFEIDILVGDDVSHVRSKLLEARLGIRFIIFYLGQVKET